MNFRSSCLLLFIVYSIAYVFGQTFQYSKGWTNGYQGEIPSKEVRAYQLERTKSLLDGKNKPQLYWPCEWSPFMEAALSRRMKNAELDTLPVAAPLGPEMEEK